MGRCSHCNRLVKGHALPIGKECKLEPIKLEEGEVAEAEGAEQSEDPKDNPFFAELLTAISRLSATVQYVLDEQNTMKVSLEAGRQPSEQTATQYIKPVIQSVPVSMALPTVEPAVSLFTGARVPAKLVQAAKAGEYVNLSDFIPSIEPSQDYETVLEEGNLIHRKKRVKRSITNLSTWLLAWAGYESLLMQDDPDRYVRLAKYRLIIQEWDMKYKWASIYSYDNRHRLELSLTKSLDFASTNMEIFASCCVSYSASKPDSQTCRRCFSPAHFAPDCPFPSGGTVEKSAQATQRSPYPYNRQSENSRNIAGEFCFSWNGGSCARQNCPRRHACQNCGGPDPLPRCLNCWPPPPKNWHANSVNQNPANKSSMGSSFNVPPK